MPKMETLKSGSGKQAVSTQKFVSIGEIKEDTIVMQDGSLRGVIAVSSTNFALKSEDEQNSMTAGYQNFLNSLDFPIQILMHSRVLDINSYLEKLRGLESGQTNELLRIQMSEYIEYVAKLVEYANIMTKTFYIVVPYSATPVGESFMSRVSKFFNPAAEVAGRQEDFKKLKIRLEERVNHVVSELASTGLRTIVLTTPELVELLYSSYNFDSGSPLRAGSLEAIDINMNTYAGWLEGKLGSNEIEITTLCNELKPILNDFLLKNLNTNDTLLRAPKNVLVETLRAHINKFIINLILGPNSDSDNSYSFDTPMAFFMVPKETVILTQETQSKFKLGKYGKCN